MLANCWCWQTVGGRVSAWATAGTLALVPELGLSLAPAAWLLTVALALQLSSLILTPAQTALPQALLSLSLFLTSLVAVAPVLPPLALAMALAILALLAMAMASAAGLSAVPALALALAHDAWTDSTPYCTAPPVQPPQQQRCRWAASPAIAQPRPRRRRRRGIGSSF